MICGVTSGFSYVYLEVSLLLGSESTLPAGIPVKTSGNSCYHCTASDEILELTLRQGI